MKNVQQVLQQKQPQLYFVIPGTFVIEALQYMMDKNISAVLVMDKDRLAGIFTERDYARKIVLKGKSSMQTPVDEVMSRNLLTVDRQTPVSTCMQIMTERRIRHLPVVEEQRVLGVVSIGDLVKAVMEEQQSTIEQLEHFISS